MWNPRTCFAISFLMDLPTFEQKIFSLLWCDASWFWIERFPFLMGGEPEGMTLADATLNHLSCNTLLMALQTVWSPFVDWNLNRSRIEKWDLESFRIGFPFAWTAYIRSGRTFISQKPWNWQIAQVLTHRARVKDVRIQDFTGGPTPKPGSSTQGPDSNIPSTDPYFSILSQKRKLHKIEKIIKGAGGTSLWVFSWKTKRPSCMVWRGSRISLGSPDPNLEAQLRQLTPIVPLLNDQHLSILLQKKCIKLKAESGAGETNPCIYLGDERTKLVWQHATAPQKQTRPKCRQKMTAERKKTSSCLHCPSLHCSLRHTRHCWHMNKTSRFVTKCLWWTHNRDRSPVASHDQINSSVAMITCCLSHLLTRQSVADPEGRNRALLLNSLRFNKKPEKRHFLRDWSVLDTDKGSLMKGAKEKSGFFSNVYIYGCWKEQCWQIDAAAVYRCFQWRFFKSISVQSHQHQRWHPLPFYSCFKSKKDKLLVYQSCRAGQLGPPSGLSFCSPGGQWEAVALIRGRGRRVPSRANTRHPRGRHVMKDVICQRNGVSQLDSGADSSTKVEAMGACIFSFWSPFDNMCCLQYFVVPVFFHSTYTVPGWLVNFVNVLNHLLEAIHATSQLFH